MTITLNTREHDTHAHTKNMFCGSAASDTTFKHNQEKPHHEAPNPDTIALALLILDGAEYKKFSATVEDDKNREIIENLLNNGICEKEDEIHCQTTPLVTKINAPQENAPLIFSEKANTILRPWWLNPELRAQRAAAKKNQHSRYQD
ncbi:hypothetical protein CVU75_02595 [Candidatus Dependentiae bacterium HGW-Dependentiae-1]|nr:MAG: hypothetical protein CVU75_02595 [Candidatus Dependentiae bacterium HGW-Dependentiae-1]